MGLTNPSDLCPSHVMRRISPNEVMSYEDIYPPVARGALVNGKVTGDLKVLWKQANETTF